MGAGAHHARRPFFVSRKRSKSAPTPAAVTAPPIGRRHAALVALAATVVAILERWNFSRVWSEAGSLTSAFYYGDAPRFVEYAIAIAQGRLFDNGIPFHPPGWPLALAGLLQLAGAVTPAGATVPVAAVKILLAVLSGAGVGLAVWLAYELAGAGAMLAVALLAPFHFGHLVEAAVADSEVLYGLLVAGALAAMWRWLDHASRVPAVWAAAAGALSGMAMLVRAEFLAGALLLLATAAWRRRRWVELACFALLWGAVLSPTAVWHWRTLSAFNRSHAGRVAGPLPRFAPVTSYGPFNFAMANHEQADGGPNSDHPMLDQCTEQHDAALAAGQLDLSCSAIYELYVDGYTIGATWLLSHPGAALALEWRKLAMTAGFLAQGYLADDIGAGIDGTRRRVDMLDPARWWLMPVHLALLAGGLVILRRQPVALALVAAPLVALTASVLLFYGYVRLGVAYLPVVWIAQGAAVAWAAGRIGGGARARRSTVMGVLGAMALLAMLDLTQAGVTRQVVLDGPRDPAGLVVQDETLDLRGAR